MHGWRSIGDAGFVSNMLWDGMLRIRSRGRVLGPDALLELGAQTKMCLSTQLISGEAEMRIDALGLQPATVLRELRQRTARLQPVSIVYDRRLTVSLPVARTSPVR